MIDVAVFIVVLLALMALAGVAGFLLRWRHRDTAILASIVSVAWLVAWRFIR
jgi:hypothetical protein